MPIRLLAVGDMHLGRRPSRIPAWLARQNDSLDPFGAWERCVEQAIAQRVDVMVLAGDLVDQEDNFFEAYGPLEHGISRLTQSGIQVLGVSGNHDVKVLPRLAEHLNQFQLLGSGGQWQSHILSKDNESLTIHGWSFPKPMVADSPLAGHVFERGPGVNIGLLHCDLDQTESTHAPVSSQALRDTPLDAWLLGHIHKPSALSTSQTRGYLGSLSGLHVGESGPRGPWLIEIHHGQIASFEQWTIAPLHWSEVDLNIEKIDDPQQAQGQLMATLSQLDQSWARHDLPPNAVGIRLRLTGASQLSSAVINSLEAGLGENLSTHSIPSVFIESIIDNTTVDIDLEYWAAQPNHAGELARSLLALEQPNDHPELAQLIAAAREKLMLAETDARWHSIKEIEWSDALVCDYLHRSGHRLLRELIAQLEEQQP